MLNTPIPQVDAIIDFNMFKDSVSQMIPTINGYHIVKVLYIKPVGKKLLVWHPVFDEFLADHQLL
jgi:hypothetical protein